ncbi:unnamed protein product [Gongylonema pulchrum]|uniref:Peptidase S1 domain-containing protein n=1 Tax=Gongylonema pulchrum TaxID=637853 RepID=A0A183E515_9BILA|nr:unnamed protein product [Gongylonema pulchrum]
MRGCILFMLHYGLAAAGIRYIPLDVNEIVVYAKPGDAIQLSRITEDDSEDLRINCGATRRQWLSTPYKIAAGTPAKIGQFPWAVAVTFVGEEQYNYCGGTIISERHILSAAHCFIDYERGTIPCTFVFCDFLEF